MSVFETRVLGLIPAKGGSSRLAKKNIALLGGKPLISWAADAARSSGVLDRLILSTEDEVIAEIAQRTGLDVPFIRPERLARDPANVADVALHALDELEAAGERYETLVILLPTCPFRTSDDIRSAFTLFCSRDEGSLMSVSKFDHTPFAALQIGDDKLITPYFSDYFGRRAQEMPSAYRPNGAIHILNVNRFQTTRSYIAPPVLAYPMPRERSIDIDTIADLRQAESMLEERIA